MTKKLISVVLMVVFLIGLCACGKKSSNETTGAVSLTQIETSTISAFLSDEIKTENLSAKEMKVYVMVAMMEDWSQANAFATQAIQEFGEVKFEESKESHSKALEKIQLAKKRIQACIASPNLIESKFNEIEEDYSKIIGWLDDPETNVIKIMQAEYDLAEKENYIMNVLQCFNNLYCIREFDELPDEEAANSLKDYWWKFQFPEEIECPETIKEEELYLIWAKQFSGNFEQSEEFMIQLKTLREKDDLGSKESNSTWAQLMEAFLFSS